MNGSFRNGVAYDNARVKKQPLRLLIVAVLIFDANGARATVAFVTRYGSVERDLSRKNVVEGLARVSFSRAISLYRFNCINRLGVHVRGSNLR